MTNIILLVLFFLGSVVAQGADNGEYQEWKVEGLTAAVLIKGLQALPGTTVENLQGLDQLTADQAACVVKVYRPALLLPPQASGDSQFYCGFLNRDGTVAKLNADIRQVGIEGWGNRPEEAFNNANGNPKPFQILDQDYGVALWKLLREQSKTESAIEKMFICDPNGVNCTESYYIANVGDGTENALVCHLDTENEQLYKSRCVFMFGRKN